ncbi:hypothetical protein [Candidatus Nitrosocosmicus arcticus]|uniref:Uncharacterized protein n=1 Tax=Candidatus Nitrosocosmicus arcticus TaxID=2035267 RepID=A0A557SY88_9ARCH|nr:hypothetical protein [Candidatus Nitrosocosmicus arcticus]TVP41569.1 hypothetical protein NARC_30284 [Candidatus Nitrosocosmicus arcticus]
MAQNNNEIIKVKDDIVAPLIQNISNNENDYDDDPLQQFIYALRAPETRRQYPRRLQVFMDFINIEGDLKQQSKILKGKIDNDKEWFKISLFKFFEF